MAVTFAMVGKCHIKLMVRGPVHQGITRQLRRDLRESIVSYWE